MLHRIAVIFNRKSAVNEQSARHALKLVDQSFNDTIPPLAVWLRLAQLDVVLLSPEFPAFR